MKFLQEGGFDTPMLFKSTEDLGIKWVKKEFVNTILLPKSVEGVLHDCWVDKTVADNAHVMWKLQTCENFSKHIVWIGIKIVKTMHNVQHPNTLTFLSLLVTTKIAVACEWVFKW